MLKPRSFDAHKNAAVLIIAMLSYLKLNMEISDVDMETMESDDCRGISESNRDANGVLAMM